MSFNLIGFFIFIGVYIPKLIYTLLNKKNVHLNKYKQLNIIEMISLSGIHFFGILTIGYGYSSINQVVDIIYASLISIFGILYYGVYLRHLICKRNDEYFYKKFLFIPYPLAVFESLIYLISGALLFNPYVIFFGLIYAPIHVFLEYKRSGGIYK